MSHLRSWRLVASFLLGSVGLLQAGVPGIDTPVAVAPYFGGVFPSSAPGDPSGWSVVNAFPNLTFTDPMVLKEIPGQNQFLVVGKNGEIWRFPKSSGATMAQRVQVADLTAATQTSEDQGFYSLAFHPKFGQAGQVGENYVYVCYSRKGVMGSSNPDASYWTLSRFTWLPGSGTLDAASELIMMSQFDPHRFHQGGALFFSNEGYLHVTVGDGGASADTFNNAQKLNMGFFAGILRIDVDYYAGKPGSHAIVRQPQDDPNWSYLGVSMARPAGWAASYSQGYGIPNDNPWLSPGGTALEEYYAVGLRSPHAAHYDATTGDIWVGDVGQTSWEELSRVVKGANCQWPYKEGPETSSFKTDPNTLADVETTPLHTYDHSVGNSIIGGMRYRGTRWASQLGGKVLFGDHVRGRIWNITVPSGGGTPIVTEMLSTFRTGPKKGLANFCTDSAGEIYMMDLAGTNNTGGRIMMLAEPVVSAEPPTLLSQTGVFSNLATLTPAAGVIPYHVPNPLWSDGADKHRWIIAPNDGSFNTVAEDIVFSAKGSWVFPAGTVFVKHFEVPTDANNPNVVKRLETRFLVCTAGGGKYGITYKWNAAGTDATLMTVGLNEDYDYNTGSGTEHKTWSYPSRGDCMVCHNDAAGQALGVRTAHLNSKMFYPVTGRTANQLETFNSLGMFDSTLTTQQLEDFIEARALDDTTAPLEHRVHSYIDTNCSHCHQPGAQGEGFDARLATSLVEENLINGIPTRYEELGAEGRYIKPGNPSLSAVYVRAAAAGDGDAMPPLAKNLAHAQGAAALQTYIQGLTEAEFQPAMGPGPQARYVRLKSITGRRRYAAVAEFAILDANGERIPFGQVSASYVRENGSGGFEPGPVVTGSEASEATDGNDGASTNFWQSPSVGGNTAPNHPHYLIFDLGTAREVGGYKYFPRLTSEDGRIFQYQVDYSTNGTTWTTWDSGTWANVATPYEFNPGYNKRPARVQVTGPAPEVMGPFDVTVAFDMDMENFAASDLQVTGGTVQKLRGSSYYYVARISPSTGSTAVQVSIPANIADPIFKTGKGRLGKGNRASTPFSVVVVPDTIAPSQPQNLAADPDLQSVALTWTASTDNVAVTGYRVYRGNGSSPIATVIGTSYTDTGLDPNTSYLYRVAAVDDAGNPSTESQLTVSTDPDVSAPSMPGSLAGDPSETGVALTWTASTDNVAVTGYRVYRGAGPDPIATVTGTGYTDTGLTPSTSYLYRVSAVDNAGNISTQAQRTVSTDPDATAPSMPGLLDADPSETGIVLTWAASTDNVAVTGYRVYRGNGPDPIATVTGTGYTDMGLTPNTSYLYRVSAVDHAGNVSAQAQLTVSTDPDLVDPSIPGLLEGDPTETTVALTWTASTDNVAVDGYRIERGSTVLATVQGLSYLDTGLSDGTAYIYKVIAIDTSSRESAAATIPVTTDIDSSAPDAPGNLLAQKSVTSINLTWSASQDNIAVTGYQVSRDGHPIATVPGTSYNDTGLDPETAYSYQVRALDARDNISSAASVSATTDPDEVAPTAPGNLSAIPDMNSIQLTWAASIDPVGLGVDRYRISRDGNIVGTVTGLTFTDTGLENGIEYDYAVVAIDEADNVSEPAVLSVETLSDSENPSPPGDLVAEADYAAIHLTWSAATDNVGVVGYEIRRSGDPTPIATVTTLGYSIEGLASGTAYTFEVRAKDAANHLSTTPATITKTTLGFADWLADQELTGQTTADSDGGGLDNFAEYRLGMDPNDPVDDQSFHLGCTMTPSAFEIVLPELKPVGHYYLQASSGLADLKDVENRILSLTPEAIAALSSEQREHYVVDVPLTSGRKFFVLIFEPLAE